MTHAVIDLGALRRNVATLAARVAPSGVMLAVKADAYGHGSLPVATAGLEAGATSLAVLDIPAGLALRHAGIGAPMLAWLHSPETDFRAGIEAGIDLGISAVWQLEAIGRAAADRPAQVHLKADTGLSRNGATAEDWPGLVQAALQLEEAGRLRIRAVWSHLADASMEDDRIALAAFEEATATARALGARFQLRHLAASSAGLRLPEARFDFVRFGIAAYGISPFDDASGADLGLQPVMSLVAHVTALEEAPSGRTLARVDAGFGDGVLPTGLTQAHVLVGSARCPVVELTVDAMLVDVTDAVAHAGDRVLVFGPGDQGEPTAEDWAGWSGTIGDEVVVGIPARVRREYRDEPGT